VSSAGFPGYLLALECSRVIGISHILSRIRPSIVAERRTEITIRGLPTRTVKYLSRYGTTCKEHSRAQPMGLLFGRGLIEHTEEGRDGTQAVAMPQLIS
jgi:hypothetical protein